MIFTIFNNITGQILRNVTVPSEDFALKQLQNNNESIIIGEYVENEYIILKDSPVRLPSKPSPHHVFNYTTKEWEDPRTAETEWPLVRAKRDNLLAQTDWVTARAYERGEPVPQNYLIYRQALRDITNQSDPFNITWPVLENAQ